METREEMGYMCHRDISTHSTVAYTIISSIRIVAKESRTHKYIISLFVFASGCPIVFFHVKFADGYRK